MSSKNKKDIENINTQKDIVENDELLKKDSIIKSHEDKYLRLFAEFDNYKKRNNKERIELLNMASCNIITSLLPIIDDFDRVIASYENNTDIETIKKGILMIFNKLNKILIQNGLKPINAVNKKFDTQLHDAINNIKVKDDDKKGIIIEEIEKGYYLNDKVIRFSKVIVGI